MSKPQVITIPPLAGVGSNPTVQVPLGTGTVTLLNLSSNLGLVLSNTEDFTTDTWPLIGGVGLPQTDVDSICIQNPNNFQVQVLVLQGVVPVTFSPEAQEQGGLTSVEGALIQNGYFKLLPAPPVGMCYKCHSLSIVQEGTGGAPFLVSMFRDVPNGSNTNFCWTSSLDGTYGVASLYDTLNGLLINNAIYIGSAGNLSDPSLISLNYDLVTL